MGRPHHRADHRRAATARTSRRTRARRSGASRSPRSRRSRTTNSTAIVGMHFDTPWATLHWRAEGTLEFSALLFVPGMKPFQAVRGRARDARCGCMCAACSSPTRPNLLPSWLRFVQGVVDTEDLPLNVSREMLQATPVLARIRKAVTGRVLSELKNRAKDAEDYAQVLGEFRRRPEGGHLGGRRAPRARSRRCCASAPRRVEGWTSLRRLRRADEGRGRRRSTILAGDDAEALARLAAARRLPRQGHRGAAAVRPDRRLLAGAAGQLRGQAAPQRHAGRARPVEVRGDGGGRARPADVAACWPR